MALYRPLENIEINWKFFTRNMNKAGTVCSCCVVLLRDKWRKLHLICKCDPSRKPTLLKLLDK